MESNFVSNKRPPDPPPPASDPNKRRHHYTPIPSPSSPSETVFRILCPSSKTGALIGKGGSVIRQIRDVTGARVHVDDHSIPFCDERVIVISANNNSTVFSYAEQQRPDSSNPNSNSYFNGDGSPAQQALVRVFERMSRVDEERPEDKERDNNHSGCNSNNNSDGGENKGSVLCRLLAPSYQVGCVLGRGGKIVEKIRQESGAQVRVLNKDQLPPCASPGDELIQISGPFPAAKKALLSVSSCLQDNPRFDGANSGSFRPLGAPNGTAIPVQVDPVPPRGYAPGPYVADYHSRSYPSVPGPENIAAGHQMFVEEEVLFRLLCQHDKVGSLIGKGGSMVRALQNETGASIKVVDAAPDSEERVVVISCRENLDQRHSPAQEAVIRVQSRIADISFEPDAGVVARLLVHSQQIGCLMGKGGFIINEMRRATGASIRIFPREQVPKCGFQNDEVVQVMGSLQSVQDALFHITSRLRETIFLARSPPPNYNGPPHMPPFSEMSPPFFRPRHHPASPGHYPAQIGPLHGTGHPGFPPQTAGLQPPFSHGIDHVPPSMERAPYPYGCDRPPSPRSWTPQAVSRGNPCGPAHSSSLPPMNMPFGSGNPETSMVNASVDVYIPQIHLPHVCGENNSHLSQIQQISGAKVVVHEPRSSGADSLVIVSGAPDQTHFAQSLIHAFILCGQTAA